MKLKGMWCFRLSSGRRINYTLVCNSVICCLMRTIKFAFYSPFLPASGSRCAQTGCIRLTFDLPLRMCTLFGLCVCYSSRGVSTPETLRVNDTESLSESGFDPENPTKILIHGFGGDGESANIIHSRDGRYGITVALSLNSIQKYPLMQH
jgi:hypothetical protein